SSSSSRSAFTPQACSTCAAKAVRYSFRPRVTTPNATWAADGSGGAGGGGTGGSARWTGSSGFSKIRWTRVLAILLTSLVYVGLTTALSPSWVVNILAMGRPLSLSKTFSYFALVLISPSVPAEAPLTADRVSMNMNMCLSAVLSMLEKRLLNHSSSLEQ